jgi:hypothetical protein
MMMHKAGIERLKPAVSKATLLFIAGAVWMVIGVMLNALSYSWLRVEKPAGAVFLASIGFICGLIIHYFGFSRIVKKNVGRILPMQGRRCLFSFMPWKSYLLVVSMILMGSFLRHSSIPKKYLAVVYTGIGTALILSGYHYLRYAFWLFNPSIPPDERS